jgi:hypothetical protein
MSASDKDESLTSVHRSWGFPTDDELRWLLHQGVSDTAPGLLAARQSALTSSTAGSISTLRASGR